MTPLSGPTEGAALLFELNVAHRRRALQADPAAPRALRTLGHRSLADPTAGSHLTLDRAVRNLMSATGIPLAEAVSCATWAPARAMSLDNEIGSLREGMRADLTVWDRRHHISHTFVEGKLAYSND